MLLPMISVTQSVLEYIPGDKEGLFYYLESFQLLHECQSLWAELFSLRRHAVDFSIFYLSLPSPPSKMDALQSLERLSLIRFCFV